MDCVKKLGEELQWYKSFVGDNMLYSDYQSADHMRKTIEYLQSKLQENSNKA
jgi:hypothetical protein